jgi:hypothetical protein
MWQQVDPNNPAQLQAAVDVLAAHDDNWTSAIQLKQWMEERDVRLFFYHDPSFDLVVGFRYLPSRDQWRLATGGGRGTLGPAAGEQMAAKIVQFLKAEGVRMLEMYTRDRAPGDPKRVLVDMAATILRDHPGVAEVSQRPSKIGRHYEAVLR